MVTRVNDFMQVWLDRQLTPSTWHAKIARFATSALADSLVGVDPLSVPATRTTGSVAVPVLTSSFAQAVIPVDSGTVTLTLVKRSGDWLVDGVDWERG